MSSASWDGPAERLDRVLPALGLARSRSRAAELIAGGRTRVDGAVVTKAGLRVAPHALIEIEGEDRYVSRAAHKLLAGLDAFAVDPAGLLALDAGASTGGFTQVLLERGAARVLAIDVGHGQLDRALREDPRVRAVEGCNARDLTPASLAEATGTEAAPALVVGDLSFISLELVLPALIRVAAADADFVLLVKPQFEVGRQGVSGGIVTDPELAVSAVARVIATAAALGLRCLGVARSPIAGEHGNREVLAHFARAKAADPVGADPAGAAGPDPTEWEQRIRELFEAGGEA